MIQALPKVSLHCHLEGSVRPSTFLALAAQNGVDLGERRMLGPDNRYIFSDFLAFLLCFRDVCTVLVRPEDYARIAREYLADALAGNVRYAELFVSPAAWQKLHPTLDIRAALQAIHTELQHGKRQGINVALIVDITRNFGAEVACETARLAIEMQSAGVIGVGLGGDERRFPAALFTDAFRLAHNAGLHCVAHAGEADGPQSIRDALELLGAERIGHGIRALEDRAVLEMLAERHITLEQCPTSNRLTGVLAPDCEHPMKELAAFGIPIAIDADDPALFDVHITDELAAVAQVHGLPFVHARLRNAVDASFASPALKDALHAELRQVIGSS